MSDATSLRLDLGINERADTETWQVPTWLTPRLLMVSCVLLILSVSIYDTYLVYFFRDTILHDERNPICEALIRRDPNGLTWFFLGKATGNLAVISVLIMLYQRLYTYRSLVAVSVATFQILLTVYLFFADHSVAVLCFDGLYSQNDRIARQAAQSLIIHVVIATTFGAAIVTIYSTRETSRVAGGISQFIRQLAVAVR